MPVLVQWLVSWLNYLFPILFLGLIIFYILFFRKTYKNNMKKSMDAIDKGVIYGEETVALLREIRDLLKKQDALK